MHAGVGFLRIKGRDSIFCINISLLRSSVIFPRGQVLIFLKQVLMFHKRNNLNLSKQMQSTADLFFIRRGCLLVMHLCAFCITWSVVEHGVECYF